MESSAAINIVTAESQSDTTNTRLSTSVPRGDITNNVSHTPSSATLPASASPSTIGATIGENGTHSSVLTNNATEETSSHSDKNFPTILISASDTPPDMTAEELRARLEDLPQELYDQIKDLTFAFDFTCEKSRCIDRKSYKPLMLLQINKALRADFIQQYYGARKPFIFVSYWYDMPLGNWPSSRIRCEIDHWLKTLSKEAVAALPDAGFGYDQGRGRPDFHGWYNVKGAIEWATQKKTKFGWGDEDAQEDSAARGIHLAPGTDGYDYWAVWFSQAEQLVF
jgi:hypothetical protein